jgi:DNA-directed RNA polymerase specialized sigma24 family protein
VLSLRFYEDLTEVDTAAILGCSVSTVKSTARDALARLRAVAPDLLAAFADGGAQ